jgi:hypothetical protein
MKHHIYWKPWEAVVYGLTELEGGFDCWSNKELAQEDLRPRLIESKGTHQGVWNWLKKVYYCRFYAVILITAKPGTLFRLGFITPDGTTKLSPEIQNVDDGIFAVRRFSLPDRYFVVGTAKVDLRIFSYFVAGSKVAQKYDKLTVY